MVFPLPAPKKELRSQSEVIFVRQALGNVITEQQTQLRICHKAPLWHQGRRVEAEDNELYNHQKCSKIASSIQVYTKA